MLLLSKILSGNKKHIPLTCIHRENALFRVYERTVLDLSRVLFIDIYFLPSASPYVSNCPGLLRTFCRLF